MSVKVSFSLWLLALAVGIVVVQGSPQDRCPLLMASGVEDSDKTGCYIVNLRKETSPEQFQAVQRRVLQMTDDHKIYGSVQHVAKAFTVKLSTYSLESIRSIADINFIEEETMAHGDQLPYHIDRIDQIDLPLDNSYQPLGTGKGVDIYILDSGVRYDHEEFENRAKYSGYDPMDNFQSTSRQGLDCHGHGTHVSSLAAGKTYGIAKEATVYSVRVLDCLNAGPWSVILDGLDYVTRVIAERRRPAVLSMSLSGGYTQSVNDAIQNIHTKGILSVVAAGNQFADACQRTPASSAYAFTVGGSASGDGIYGFTNFGQCVDMFAPGTNIQGADRRCASCSKVISGTSMATPMVSGVVAINLQREPMLSPDALRSRLIDTAVVNHLDFRSIPNSYRRTTPNRHIRVIGDCGGSYEASMLSSINSPQNPVSYPPNINCKWTIRATSGQTVQLNFISFFSESNHDIVKVCDGSSCACGKEIATLSGELSFNNRQFTSRGEVMSIEMTSDGNIELQGFSATYQSTGTAEITTTPPPPATSRPLTVPPPTAAPITMPPTTGTVISTTMFPDTMLPTDGPTSVIDTCNTDAQVNLLLTDILQEATTVIQKVIADSLSNLLKNRVLGLVPSYPAASCKQLAEMHIRSGYYWIKSSNGSPIKVYCDVTASWNGNGRGWMRVADLDMDNSSHRCPNELKTWNTPRRCCGRRSNRPGCSSVFIPTNGVPYRGVCGKIIGFQYSSPNAFYAHQYDPEITLEGYYVDGVSLTYGRSPRKHIWTFAAARSEVDSSGHICPCTNRDNTLPDIAVPEFIGTDFFCDTGSQDRYEMNQFYEADPLWDGKGCGSKNSCCGEVPSSGYFCTDLGEETTESIELRVCGNENTDNEDTPINYISLFVQ